jgi:HrpA-like RNA helicase
LLAPHIQYPRADTRARTPQNCQPDPQPLARIFSFGQVFHSSSKDPDDYVQSAISQVLSVHAGNTTTGDVLVFMTGQEDVLATCSLMREKFDQAESKGIDVQPYEIVPVYGSLPAEQQELIFKRCGQIVGRV